MFLMKISVASVLYFAVSNKCQWQSHKGPEGSQRADMVGSQMLPAWEPSLRLDLSSPGPEEKSWKVMAKSQFPG